VPPCGIFDAQRYLCCPVVESNVLFENVKCNFNGGIWIYFSASYHEKGKNKFRVLTIFRLCSEIKNEWAIKKAKWCRIQFHTDA
jgi:hypothetical protein